MYIQSVEINNFRGLSISIDDLKRDFLIIGKNDSGKSNLCYAIRKVLDYSIRKNPLNEADSSNYNKEPISIKIKFNLEDITLASRSALGPYIDKSGDKESLTVNYEGIFNEEIQYYEERIYFGALDFSKDFSSNFSNPLDKVIEVIYINPNYNYEKDEKNFFKYRQSKNVEAKKTVSTEIISSVEQLNENIKKDPTINEIKDELNSQQGFDSIFDDVQFDMSSNISISNLHKSLSIIPLNKDGKEINSIGDGKNKTLSMLLQKMSHDSDKHNILIVEEPENHLYPLLQKRYADLTSKMNMNQMIYTTHSAHIIDFKKMDQIVKLVSSYTGNVKITEKYAVNISENDYSKFGYLLNEEIAEMFFYDKVLLVEGVSEKYFYNALFIQDRCFREFMVKSKMGVFCVGGIDFSPAKELLSKLGIEVYIKTDNDIFKVPKIKMKRYAGYDRSVNCLDNNSKDKLAVLLGKKKIDKQTFRFEEHKETDELIEQNMVEINKIFEENGVYISLHHNGFEEDFLDFIGESKIDNDDLMYLQKAKLKNLHRYVQESDISLSINDRNKNSNLVRFMSNA